MKKILPLLIICFIISCSEKRVVMDSVTNKGTVLVPIIYSENKPFSGVVYDIHKSGSLLYEGKFKNGNINGPQKVWYESGQLLLEENFIDGKKDGLQM
jgi:antitoxin component YwqK of YwqJK toxin-antitoxin module